MLVDAAAPNTDHQLISRLRQFQPLLVAALRPASQKRVDRNPVAAANEERDIVDLEEEGVAGLMLERSADDAETAEADVASD